MHSRFVLGLIGGIASGKSTALKFFKSQGIDCFSADELAHQLLADKGSIYQAICQRLGQDVILPDGQLKRDYLRRLLISSKEFKTWLENLMHPEIQKRLQHLAATSLSPYCVLEIPLLKDPKPYGISRILCIEASAEEQRRRLQQRKLSEADIEGLLELQIPQKKRAQMADDMIENTQDINTFVTKLDQLHHGYLKRAKSN